MRRSSRCPPGAWAPAAARRAGRRQRGAAAQARGPPEADCDPGGAARARQDLPLQQADVLPQLVREAVGAGRGGVGGGEAVRERALSARARGLLFCTLLVSNLSAAALLTAPPGPQAGPPHQALQRRQLPAAREGRGAPGARRCGGGAAAPRRSGPSPFTPTPHPPQLPSSHRPPPTRTHPPPLPHAPPHPPPRQDAEFFDQRNPVGQKMRHAALEMALADMEAWLEMGARAAGRGGALPRSRAAPALRAALAKLLCA